MLRRVVFLCVPFAIRWLANDDIALVGNRVTVWNTIISTPFCDQIPRQISKHCYLLIGIKSYPWNGFFPTQSNFEWSANQKMNYDLED